MAADPPATPDGAEAHLPCVTCYHKMQRGGDATRGRVPHPLAVPSGLSGNQVARLGLETFRPVRQVARLGIYLFSRPARHAVHLVLG